MSQTLKIDNFGALNRKETTQVGADVAAAATTITLLSTKDISATKRLIFGRIGTEHSELPTVQSITDDTHLELASPGLKFPHSLYEEVVVLFGSQIEIWRASNVDGNMPADSAFSLLAGGTIDIDFDQMSTEFTDAAGGSDYWYKFKYKDPTSGDTTSLADCVAVRGGGVGNYVSIEDIRHEAGFDKNIYITDGMVDTARQAAQAEINGALYGLYPVPFSSPINPLIVDLAKRLAAGLLLTTDYGPMTSGSNKNGNDKLDKARKDLMRIANKELILTNIIGNSTANPATNASSWPNNQTATTPGEDGGGERMFRVSKVY